MPQLETKVSHEIMWALNGIEGLRLFRNDAGRHKLANGSWVISGLCKGSSDLIGIYKGMFVAIEIKTMRGRISDEQFKFIRLIRHLGGFALVIRKDPGFNQDELRKEVQSGLDLCLQKLKSA